MSRARLLPVAMAIILAACSVEETASPVVHPDGEVPFDLLDPEAVPLVAPTTTILPPNATICFVDAAGRVRPDGRRLGEPITPQGVVALLTPRRAPAPTELRTALPTNDAVRGVRVAAGVATVDLGESLTALVPPELRLAVAQIVCTLTSLPGIGQVAFTLDGAPIEVPTASGSLTASPVTRDDVSDLITPTP